MSGDRSETARPNPYGLSEAQLAAADAWLERARVWTKAHPEALFYPCGWEPCECGDCKGQRHLPGVEP